MFCSSKDTGSGSGMRRWKGSGWQVCRERHPYGAWEVSGTPHAVGQRPLPQGLAAPCCCSPCSGLCLVGGESCFFLPGMAPMVCQSSGCAVTLVLLEIVGSLAGRQHSVPGRALAAASCSCCVLTSFPDFFSPLSCKKRGNQREAKIISLLGSRYRLKFCCSGIKNRLVQCLNITVVCS